MPTVRERFASEHGMPEHDVTRLVHLADRAKSCGERACNGDWNPSGLPGESKAEASARWEATVADITVQIADLVRQYGFAEVCYTGLRPCLKKNGQYVEIPS